jgi:poly(beta-D-mannuronate) lyase
MTTRILALFALVLTAVPLLAQKVTDPSASIVDVAARQTSLKSTTDPLLRNAIAHLHSCIATPPVAAPQGPMEIPHHYLHASNGPTNPAEREATRVYAAFADRIESGMNQWVATGNRAEAQCALAQLDIWAQANALANYDPKAYSQSWDQAEWSLSAAGIVDSVLHQDSTLDPAQQARVTQWLRSAAHQLISYEHPGKLGNNHHYWRALAATSIGVAAKDNDLFRFGVDTFKQAVSQEDSNGAFPLEMARHENAIHYQAFALQPLIMIAEFAERQHVDLYSVSDSGRTLRNAIVFLGQAIADPSIVKQYTLDPQRTGYDAASIAELEFYIARFGAQGLPSSLTDLLQHPATSSDIGGSATVLAAKPGAHPATR